MRFLKNKIRLAEEALQRKQKLLSLLTTSPLPSETSDTTTASSPSKDSLRPRSKRLSSYLEDEQASASTFTKPTKNIVINYGKAIFSFASSDLAKPYIERHFAHEKINLNKFYAYLTDVRPRISGFKNFELLFVVDEKDSAEIVLYKKMMSILGQIFIKYFSVNWIMHGKVAHKLIYLKHRYLILRKIAKF